MISFIEKFSQKHSFPKWTVWAAVVGLILFLKEYFEKYQLAQEAKFGLVDYEWFHGLERWQGWIIIGTMLAAATLYGYQQGKWKKLGLRLNLVALSLMVFSPLICGFFLQANASRADNERVATCKVLMKWNYDKKISLYECTPLELARQTLTEVPYELLAEGDKVKVVVKAGRWKDYSAFQEKVAN